MRRARTVVCALALAVLVPACSSDNDDATPTTTAPGDVSSDDAPTTTAAPEPVDRPDGPAAEVVEALPDDGSPFLGASRPTADLEGAGFRQQEFVVRGTAVGYEAEGELSADGEWTLTPTEETGDYTTRIVVRRPADPADGNGTVLLEWLNVSGGVDANPDYAYTEEEILRGGYTWIGVSAQRIGVEGGPVAVSVAPDNDLVGAVAGKGLKAIAPERYGELSHPGDRFSFDLYTQIARAVRADDGTLLDGVPAERLIAVGESQSGFALTTYANGVQPLTEAFDGFFIHSRGGAPLPLAGREVFEDNVDIASALAGTPTHIREDLRAPTLMIQAEADVVGVLNFYVARQPDSDTVRTWEMAGTSHVDQHLLGPIADTFECGAEINDGPMHLILKAALRGLDTWVRDGTPPPAAEPLEVVEAEGAPSYVRDDLGIVRGGVRTPPVDVPTRVLSGTPGPISNVVCLLAGTTMPLSPGQLADRYESVDAYEAEYAESLDATIDAGFILEEDRDAALDMAMPEVITG